MTLRAVYDTMLFFQAASEPGRTHATMRAVADGAVTLCLSRELLAEATDVLTRPEYAVRFPAMNLIAALRFLANLEAQAAMFDPVPAAFTWPQHPDDDHLFDLAIHAGADFLVTWETRILNLASAATPAAARLRGLAPQLAIVTPAAFAAVVRRPTP